MAFKPETTHSEQIVHIRLWEDEQDGYFLAKRQGEFFMPTKDTRDPLRFLLNNTAILKLQDEEADYMMTREGSLSFPTPKLGAKSRAC